jgi:nitronate monooxygenase
MALSTQFTQLFGVRHPIALAPMGGSAGGALAAAVSHGGGLGMVGAGNGDREWLARELPIRLNTAAGKASIVLSGRDATSCSTTTTVSRPCG